MALKVSKKKLNGVSDDGRQINECQNDSGLRRLFIKLVRTERIIAFLADVVGEEDTTKDSSNESAKISNKFQWGIDVMLHINVNAIISKLILNDVTSALVSEQPSVKAHLKKSLHHLRRE